MNKLTNGWYYSPCQQGISLQTHCPTNADHARMYGDMPKSIVTPSCQFNYTVPGGKTEELQNRVFQDKMLQNCYFLEMLLVTKQNVRRAYKFSPI